MYAPYPENMMESIKKVEATRSRTKQRTEGTAGAGRNASLRKPSSE